MKTRLGKICLIILIFCTLDAHSQEIQIEYDGRVLGTEKVDLTYDNKSMKRSLGMFKMNVVKGKESLPWMENQPEYMLDSLYAFCVQFGTPIKTDGVADYKVIRAEYFFQNKLKVEMMGRLYTLAYRDVLRTKGTDESGIYAAAMQSAVWEILYDHESINFNTGIYQIAPGDSDRVRKVAEHWLSRLATTSSVYDFTVLRSKEYQDLIVAKPLVYDPPEFFPMDNPPTIIPLPYYPPDYEKPRWGPPVAVSEPNIVILLGMALILVKRRFR